MKAILTKINKIMQSVEYVKKTANVQGYKAVTHDEVVAKIRPAMVENGVILSMSVNSSELQQAGQTKNGSTIWLYNGAFTATFYDCETGENLAVNVEAQAMDHGDKAAGKALSYATKYAILKTFALETGENDESRQEIDRAMDEMKDLHRSRLITSIENLNQQLNGDLVSAIKFITANKSEVLEDLSNAQLERLNANLQNRA